MKKAESILDSNIVFFLFFGLPETVHHDAVFLTIAVEGFLLKSLTRLETFMGNLTDVSGEKVDTLFL